MDENLLLLPGNAEQFHLEHIKTCPDSLLKGLHIGFLGSSVTLGAASLDVSFADYMAKRNQFTFVKEAVSGTTLVDSGEDSYIPRMLHRMDPTDKFDVFICQLSTNDASQGKPMGMISDAIGREILEAENWRERLEELDRTTVAGAIEFILVYARKTWKCPVFFYTGTRYDSTAYQEMVDLLFAISKKWGIGVIDLWNDPQMLAVEEEDYALYMNDPIHPTQAGYLLWWTPVMEKSLISQLFLH